MRLGEKYTDDFTGYTGVATARTEYLGREMGSVCLVRGDSTGKPEEVWVPEDRLTPCEKAPPGFSVAGQRDPNRAARRGEK